MNARAAGIIEVIINIVVGLAFVHSGAAGWLWERVEADVPWRTGPTALGVITYFAFYWAAWIIVNELITRATPRRSAARDSERSAAAGFSFAASAFVASCAIVAIQVLTPAIWLIVTLALLLIVVMIDALIVREPLRRAIVAWAWSGAGVALATLMIHPYFAGLPLFVVRLAVVMTAWDWVGARIGVTPRLLRLVPSLYSGSSSGRTAAQARAAR